MLRRTTGENIFNILNITFLSLAAFLCLMPIVNVLAISFSTSYAAAAGTVKLWPVGFNISSYVYALSQEKFLSSFVVSLERVALGGAVNMLITILVAYPLSKETKEFSVRTWYAWFFFVTLLFGGGLIPWYMTIRELHLIDSIWALVLPGAVPVFNAILLLNFMRQLPKEIQESALVDGAGQWTILWRIIVPLSIPALATIFLFTFINHWNSWFDGLILMNRPEHYPLQTYLQSVVVSIDEDLLKQASPEQLKKLREISNRTTKASQLFLATLPILLLYPFLQKYFIKGIVMGSVKE